MDREIKDNGKHCLQRRVILCINAKQDGVSFAYYSNTDELYSLLKHILANFTTVFSFMDISKTERSTQYTFNFISLLLIFYYIVIS